MVLILAQFGIGLVLLYFGAGWLVRGASALALKLGLMPLIVGLTVVAFGTSAPELIVSLDAGFEGRGGLAIGNVIGSNIANIALVLGLASVVRPLRVQAQLVRFDVPVMIAVTVVLVSMLHNYALGRVEGLLLAALLVIYIAHGVYHAHRGHVPADRGELDETPVRPPRSTWLYGLLIAAGLLTLAAGADTLVRGAVGLARAAGLSEAVIGLTVIAIGTSLPELATSTIASWKREGDIAVGNVIGSNLFNILAVLGITASAVPLVGAGILRLDLLVMLAIAVIAWPILRTGFVVSRVEGAALVLVYAVFLAWRVTGA